MPTLVLLLLLASPARPAEAPAARPATAPVPRVKTVQPVAAGPSSRTPQASLAAADEQRLTTLLDMKKRSPTLDELLALGNGVEASLIKIVQGPASDLRRRSRAVLALGQIGTSPARTFLNGIVDQKTDAPAEQEAWLVGKAALALAYMPDARTMTRLQELLEHPDRDVKLDAIAAIGATRRPEAIEILEEFIGQENDPHIVKLAERQLESLKRQVEAPPPPPRRPRRIRPPDFNEREQPGVPRP